MPRLLELTTIQSQPFRSLFEALKEVLTDCNIHFDDTGMKILALDGTKVILAHCKLRSENFQTYYCKRPLIIGINVICLYKLLKNINSDGTLTLFIDEDNPDELGILINSEQRNTNIEVSYKLLDIDDDFIELPPIEFDSVVTMPSSEFQTICRNMAIISDTIEIYSARKQLTMSCSSDFAPNFSVTMTDKGVDSCISFVQTADDDVIYQAKFKIEHMISFTKATSLSKTIEIFFKNDYPIILKYVIADLGDLKYVLAPKVEEA